MEETEEVKTTLHRPTIIDHLIPRTELLLESPPVAVQAVRAGGRASGLEQQVEQRQVTRWDRVQTRTETRHIRSHRHRKGATAGLEETMRAKGLRERRPRVQARHLVHLDTKVQGLDQPGDAEVDGKCMSYNMDDIEFETSVGNIDNSDLLSTDSSSTYTPSEPSSDSCSDMPASESPKPEPALQSQLMKKHAMKAAKAHDIAAQDLKAQDVELRTTEHQVTGPQATELQTTETQKSQKAMNPQPLRNTKAQST